MTLENPQSQTIRINTSMVRIVIGVLAFGGGLASGVFAAAQWKTSVDDHLQRIEEHLKDEDKNLEEERHQLQWLIQHNKDSGDAPTNWVTGPSRLTVPLPIKDQAAQDAQRFLEEAGRRPLAGGSGCTGSGLLSGCTGSGLLLMAPPPPGTPPKQNPTPATEPEKK